MEYLWYLLPVLMLVAAYFPLISSVISQIDIVPQGIVAENSHWLKKIIGKFGENGNILFAIVPASLCAMGIWQISRALGANIQIAAIFSSLYIAAPILKLAPNFLNSPQGGIFAGLIAISTAQTMRAIKNKSQTSMAWAFIFAAAACWFRPYAIWPVVAVFIAIILITNIFEDRPKYGFLSALCWGPLLFYAYSFSKFIQKSDYSFFIQKPTLFDKTEVIEFGYFLFNSIPFLILIASAIFALIILNSRFKNEKPIKAFIILSIIAILGAIGYQDVIAARFIIDTFALGAIAAAIRAPPIQVA